MCILIRKKTKTRVTEVFEKHFVNEHVKIRACRRQLTGLLYFRYFEEEILDGPPRQNHRPAVASGEVSQRGLRGGHHLQVGIPSCGSLRMIGLVSP